MFVRKICFATNNLHKIEEVQALLPANFVLQSLSEIGCKEELTETQKTLQGNALQKAKYVAENYGVSCFADDTGLEIEALQGEPGVYSARYAGEERNSLKNIELVLQKMKGVTQRDAQFRTIIALILQDKVHYFEGVVKGTITHEPRGTQGFGYDPIFMPEGYDKTFAEMTLQQKNSLSHRAKAIQQLVKFLVVV
jgi:XTP/dITP diphosphohydrolase